ncbi:MAG: N-acetylmuramoyl-L-alanine amidase, partial [Candidatus Aminicenantes bacterium]|nr:N-acetylmuramoyl-L-alanine amidase [Candidatus Aminicenantes bacterium]
MPRQNYRMRPGAAALWLALVLGVFSPTIAQGQPVLKVRVRDFSDYSRVALETPQTLTFAFERAGATLRVKVDSRTSLRILGEPVDSRVVKSLNWAKQGNIYILTIEAKVAGFNYNFYTLSNPFQLMIDITPEAAVPSRPAAKPAPPPPVVESPAQAATLPPGAKGIRTIVIDPGHGGLESGANGRFGTLEKEVTLAIALKLKALVERNMA